MASSDTSSSLWNLVYDRMSAGYYPNPTIAGSRCPATCGVCYPYTASAAKPAPKPEPYAAGERLKVTLEGEAYKGGSGNWYVKTAEGGLIKIADAKVERVEDLKYGDLHQDAGGRVYRYVRMGNGDTAHPWQSFGNANRVPDHKVKRPLKRIHREAK